MPSQFIRYKSLQILRNLIPANKEYTNQHIKIITKALITIQRKPKQQKTESRPKLKPTQH